MTSDGLSIDDVVGEANRLRANVSVLADVPTISRRTVRYYVQVGLVRPPGTRGTTARYPESAVYQVLFIRLLQQTRTKDSAGEDRRPTLEDIKRALREVPEETVKAVVLGKERLEIRLSLTAKELQELRTKGEQILHLTGSGVRLDDEDAASLWRRMRIMPGVELRVRRKLSAKQERQLRLIARLIAESLSGSR